MKVQIVNCFCTDEPHSGNPAAIVNDFIGNREAKQKFAKELALPVTVFLSENNDSYYLEYFYPDAEMPMCLHGTLGAAYTLLHDPDQTRLSFLIKNDRQLLIRKQENILQVKVSKQPAPEVIPDADKICKMLNLTNPNRIETTLPLTISSVGSPKLLIPLKKFTSLVALKPDFACIATWSIENDVNGLYIYTTDSQDSSLDFYARGFNPKTGHNEDAATGVAAAALAASLRKDISIGQGIFLNRPSKIKVSYIDSENIWVGGKIVPG